MQKIDLSPGVPRFVLDDAPVSALKQAQVRDSLFVTRARLGLDVLPPVTNDAASSCASSPDEASTISATAALREPVRPAVLAAPLKPCAIGGPLSTAKLGADHSSVVRAEPRRIAQNRGPSVDSVCEPASSTGTLPRWGRALQRVFQPSAYPLLPEQRAAAVHQWLRANGLVNTSCIKPKQRLRALCAEDATNATWLARPTADIQADLIWLDNKDVRALREMLIDRAHAELCGAHYVVPILLEALRIFFTLQQCPKKQRKPALATRLEVSGAAVFYLRSPHTGGITFRKDCPQQITEAGAWYLGVTKTQQPVAIKELNKALLARIDPQALDRLRCSQYIVRHETDTHLYHVTPLYEANLHDAAPAFFKRQTVLAEAQMHSPCLLGARYLFAEVERAVRLYQRNKGGPHGRICAAALFVDKKNRHLVLGDEHTRCDAGLDDAQSALRYPQEECPPEQIAGLAPTNLCDVFGMCNMIMRLILVQDPDVQDLWQTLFVKKSKPSFLLGGYNLGFAQKIFEVWSKAPTPQREAEVVQDPCLSHIPIATQKACLARFDAIDQVMSRLDPVLWQLLQCGLRGDASHLANLSAQLLPTLDKLDFTASQKSDFIDAIWNEVPAHAQGIADALLQLGQISVQAQPTSRSFGQADATA